MQAAMRLIRTRSAQNCVQRLAIKEQDALISISHGGQISLDHHRNASLSGGHVDDRVEVDIAPLEDNQVTSASSVQWLDHRASAKVLYTPSMRVEEAVTTARDMRLPTCKAKSSSLASRSPRGSLMRVINKEHIIADRPRRSATNFEGEDELLVVAM
jgi:hypothetical protein